MMLSFRDFVKADRATSGGVARADKAALLVSMLQQVLPLTLTRHMPPVRILDVVFVVLERGYLRSYAVVATHLAQHALAQRQCGPGSRQESPQEQSGGMEIPL